MAYQPHAHAGLQTFPSSPIRAGLFPALRKEGLNPHLFSKL